MSDDAWWKVRKAASLERAARARAAASGVRRGDAFLIVTEGRVTEVCYFRQLRAALGLSAVQVHVRPGATPDAEDVVRTAANLAAAQRAKKRRCTLPMTEPEKFDHVWAVVDTDVAVQTGKWPAVLALAQAKNVRLAPSTPCIEFWLLLHIRYSTPQWANGAQAKTGLAKECGTPYPANEKEAEKFIASLLPKWPDAVPHAERVREEHAKAGTAMPATPSTEVDHLARALNDSAPEHLRRLR